MGEHEKVNIVALSPEMTKYLEEVKRAAGTLCRIGHAEQFFEQRLLLSMNEGWGEEEFVEVIKDTLLPYYNVSDETVVTRMIRVPKDKGPTYWENQVQTCADMIREVSIRNGFCIFVCDLKEYMENLNSKEFMRIMKQFAEKIKGALFILWIPYVGEEQRKKIEDKFSTIMSLQSLGIPPITREKQMEYMSYLLEQKDFRFGEDCKEILQKWLEQREEEGSLSGYHSLENMCDGLIYKKVLSNDDLVVSPADIERMMFQPKYREDAYELLNELIGMAQLKAKVREIVAQIKLQKELAGQGRKIKKPSLHMAFMGNPGTGKTTLARILGQIFRQEGILRKGEFYEHSGNEFLEGNVSDMVRRMRKACKEAYGSIMFIDEAYGMAIGHSNGNTGDDIVPILVEEMENRRDDLCVIFAGYEDEMDAFFKTNSGLKSRIPHILHFPTYSKEELIEIFIKMTEGSFEYEEELIETLQDYLEDIAEEQYESKEFSNARFIRNLYERVWGKTAYRINFTEDKEVVLKNVDLQAALEEEIFASMLEKKETKRIGFEMK